METNEEFKDPKNATQERFIVGNYGRKNMKREKQEK
jgi:hypothetical protein